MALGESQGFYVNGSIGKWIRENLQNPCRKVSAKYKTYCKYESGSESASVKQKKRV